MSIRKREGFTLLEILVATAISFILFGFLLQSTMSVTRFLKKSREAGHINTLLRIQVIRKKKAVRRLKVHATIRFPGATVRRTSPDLLEIILGKERYLVHCRQNTDRP